MKFQCNPPKQAAPAVRVLPGNRKLTRAFVFTALAAYGIFAARCATAQSSAQTTPGQTNSGYASPGPRHSLTAAQAQTLGNLRTATILPAVEDTTEATDDVLRRPVGLAFDTAGNLFVADPDSNSVREITLKGDLLTVAGNSRQGFSGDGGLATEADFDSPTGVAVDAAGNIYIADTHNNRIRKVSNGIVTTIAGNGMRGYAGDTRPATAAELNRPVAVAVDAAGHVFIADTDNERIREISNGLITTLAGDGRQMYAGDDGFAILASLDSPKGVGVDAAGNIYISDTHNQRIRKVVESSGIISTLGGNGQKTYSGDNVPATQASFAAPIGLSVTTGGIVYFADSDNHRIRIISDGIVTTAIGDGFQGFSGDTSATHKANLNKPRSVAWFGDAMAFSDTDNNRVREIIDGQVDTIGGTGPSETETLLLSGAAIDVYGTGTITGQFSNNGHIASGLASFLEVTGTATLIGSDPFHNNTATTSLATLSAGTHAIAATYPGDAINAPIASGIFIITVTPAPLIAQAMAIEFPYGSAVPPITGSLTGVLAQDTLNVAARFSTTATSASPAGTYPITVSLAGVAAHDYTVQLSPSSGMVTIDKAPTATTLSSSNLAPLSGAIVTLSARVTSLTTHLPTGTVSFFAGEALLAANVPVNSTGLAVTATSKFGPGAQSAIAVYNGDLNFTGSQSLSITETLPGDNFAISATPAHQTILPGAMVGYAVTITPLTATLGTAVTLTATGLPDGATAVFSPASFPAGSPVSHSTIVIQPLPSQQ